MAEAVTETSPLLSTVSEPTTVPEFPRPNSKRTVTFNPNPVTRTIEPERQPLRRRISTNIDVGRASNGQRSPGGSGPPTPTSSISTGSLAGAPPMLAALNSKLRRRNSHGGTQGSYQTMGSNTLLPAPGGAGIVAAGGHLPKIGPQRSTKKAQKLKLLPTPEIADEGDEVFDQDEESGREVYSQYTRIKDPNARRDAARLGKADRDRLPRVTAYCTANKYQMDGLMHWLKGSRSKAKGANPKLVDECIYTPYQYRDTAAPPPGRGARIRRVANARNAADAAEDAARASATNDNISAGDADSHSIDSTSTQRRHSTGDVQVTPPRFSQEDLIDLQPEPIPDVQDVPHEAGIVGLGEGDSAEISSSPQDRDHDHAHSPSSAEHRDEMISTHHEPINERPADFDIDIHTPEVFLFDYGVVVIWGMTMAQEGRFLKEIAKFETEKLATEEVETEHFNFYYTREYQPRIYNDFITLRDKHNYMTKLAISHALAQSVKTSLFEELIASTVDTCKDIPTQIALTGKINLSRTQINMQIGELFILRISIHLNGSVLDTPELFWVEPQLEPLYAAVRSYLEMDQRVGLLNERLDVIADLLAVLKDQLSHGHGEKLEWIVIVLIAAEILVAAVNIVVDLYAGVD